MNDPDAGPVFRGYGTAACAFGIPASKAAGRFDHTRSLASQALVAAWPLPDGTLLGPRFLSNMTEAPYLGEATLTFIFARQAKTRIIGPATQTRLPRGVYLGLAVYLALGLWELGAAAYTLRRWRRHGARARIPIPRVQIALWCTLCLTAWALWYCDRGVVGLVFLLATLCLPQYRAGSALKR